MVFAVSVLCYVSIATAYGYILYKYFLSTDEIKKDEIVPPVLKQHVKPVCNKNEYTRISPTDDFDIINANDLID